MQLKPVNWDILVTGAKPIFKSSEYDLLTFLSCTKCGSFHSIGSLRRHFEIHNNNKPFPLMSQSQSIGWVG